jgi:hypothetical protein
LLVKNLLFGACNHDLLNDFINLTQFHEIFLKRFLYFQNTFQSHFIISQNLLEILFDFQCYFALYDENEDLSNSSLS